MLACLMSCLLSETITGQNKAQNQVENQTLANSTIIKNILIDKIGNWTASEASHTLGKEQVSNLLDGDVYIEYGVQSLTIRFYTFNQAKIAIELFQTKYPSETYGLATFIRNSRDKNRLAFNKGNFLLAITGETTATETKESVLNQLSDKITSEDGELPSLIFKLPKAEKLDNTERYVIGPVTLGQIEAFAFLKESVNFTSGTHAITAKYQNGPGQMNLAIIEYHTPQLATDGYAEIQRAFEKLSSPDKNSHLLRRIGNYIIVSSNVQDVPSAERVIAEIKYSPNIYWEGNKLSNIPARFRPTDPLVLEEASQTANVVIRTFYWIGVMILGAIVIGLIAGGSLFYWNRYRRYKLGTDNTFSDAGGAVRLNLDNFLPEPVDYSLSPITRKKKEDQDKKNGGHN